MKKTFLAMVVAGTLLVGGAGCEKEAMNHDAMDQGAMMEKPGSMMKLETTTEAERMAHEPEDTTPNEGEQGGVMIQNKATINGDTGVMKGEVKTETGVMIKKEGGTMTKSEPTIAKVGTYQAYSPEKLALAKTGKVVIFFKAGWCHTCQALGNDIEAHLSDIPGNVNILIADYDTSTELKRKYGITYQHSFVQVDANGGIIKKWSGSPTLATLVGEIK